MNSTRQRLAAMTLLAGLTSLGIGLTAGPANADVNSDCQAYLGQSPSGSLHMTSIPAAGSSVPVGSAISVAGTWDDHAYNETDKFFVCVSVEGVQSASMSSVDRGVANNGSHSGTATISASVPVGANICIVSALRGQSAADKTTLDMVSEKLCYTAAAVATTTTTMATTTTTAPPIVEAKVVESGDPAPTTVEVAAAPVEAPAPLPVLPRTGAGIEFLAGFGGLSLAAGGVASIFGRRGASEG